MKACCRNSYNHTFDLKRARKELDKYLTSGPKKTTQHLLDHLTAKITAEHSLLDIGGGVGALPMELLERGIDRISYIDISDAYTQIFREQMQAMALDDKVLMLTGDFIEHHEALPAADIVTMDKVICCYENFGALLNLSLQKARKLFAYTIPMDVWWVKSVHWIEDSYKKLVGSHLRTYIHPVQEIEELVVKAGFTKDYEKTHMGWLTAVYCK